MAIDTFIVIVGVYADVETAEADYELIKDLHTEAGLIDAYDAAVIHRRDDDKVKIVRKHETPTRVGGVLGGGLDWRLVWSWHCFPSRRSEAGFWRLPRRVGQCWVRWRGTPLAG